MISSYLQTCHLNVPFDNFTYQTAFYFASPWFLAAPTSLTFSVQIVGEFSGNIFPWTQQRFLCRLLRWTTEGAAIRIWYESSPVSLKIPWSLPACYHKYNIHWACASAAYNSKSLQSIYVAMNMMYYPSSPISLASRFSEFLNCSHSVPNHMAEPEEMRVRVLITGSRFRHLQMSTSGGSTCSTRAPTYILRATRPISCVSGMWGTG